MNKFEEYCLTLADEKKVRLIEILRESLEKKNPGKTFDKMHRAIVKVMGCEVITKSNCRQVAIGRTILAYACATEGWTEHMIGGFLQRDHSSVNIMKKRMKGWLNLPQIFKIENDLYVKFLKELNNETDR